MQQSQDPPAGAPPSGITAPAPLTPSENVAEFEATWKQFADAFQPSGIVEQTLVYHAATVAWRLRRIPFVESVLLATVYQSRSASRELEFLSRHETRLIRTFHQIVRHLKPRPRDSATGASPGERSKPASQPDVPPPAPPSDFTYRAGTAASPAPSLVRLDSPATPAPDPRPQTP